MARLRREPGPPRTELGPCVVVISGVPAAGKSTVARLLAERLQPRSAHIPGDSFRRMIVNGREDVGPSPSPEALEQLLLRYRASTATADAFATAGFTVVLQDVVMGSVLQRFVDQIQTRPRYVVVLHPRADVVATRDAVREKSAYTSFAAEDFWELADAETPRLGLWLDTSTQVAEQTVETILHHIDAAELR